MPPYTKLAHAHIWSIAYDATGLNMNLQELERNVIEVCGEVGDFIYSEGSDFDRSRIEQKNGFNNLVSYVDQEAERRLVKVLKKILPEAGFTAFFNRLASNVTNRTFYFQEQLYFNRPLHRY